MKTFFSDFINVTLLILTTFASCFAYNSVSPLAEQLMVNYNKPSSIVSTAIMAHGIPSAFMSIFMGYFADKYGFMWSFIPSSLCVVIGNLIIACSGHSYAAFITGRVIFGLGGEPTLTIQNKAITVIFEGKKKDVVFGFAYFGYMLAELLSATLDQTTLRIALWSQFGVCCASFCAVCILSYKLRHVHKSAELPKIHLKVFPKAYWLGFVSRICAMTFMNTLPSLVTVFNKDLRGDTFTASFVILQAVSMVTYLLAGYCGDYIIIIGTILFSAGMWIFYYTPYGVVVNGLGTGCVGAMSSSLISRVVGPSLAGSGMGLLFFTQFFLQSIWVVIANAISDIKNTIIIYAILPLFSSIGFIVLKVKEVKSRSLQNDENICEICTDSTLSSEKKQYDNAM